MSAPAETGAAIDEVVLWRILSLCLATPTPESLGEACALAETHARLFEPLPALSELRDAIAAAPSESLAVAQQRLFGGHVELAPYEGSYEDDTFRQARQLSDIAGFYRAFGAAAHGPSFERPDHAGCELEFLAFLAARRLSAVEDGDTAGASRCAEVESAFLRDHAGRWLPTFFRALTASASDAFHAALGRLGAETVECALRRRAIEPETIGARARRLSVEADRLDCAMGDEQVLQARGTAPGRPSTRPKDAPRL